MHIKGLFSNRSVLFQSGLLLYFAFTGVLLSSAFGFAINFILRIFLEGFYGDSTNTLFYFLHINQFFYSILIFILPSICTAYFCSNKPSEFLCIKRSVNIRTLALSAVMVFLISPVIDIASYLNSQIRLPEFMASVSEWMLETENRADQLTEKLLSQKGFFALITNIFVIGIMAGLTEEILFRGALMSIIRKKIKNPHAAIWIIAIIFSFIHFQFSGFIPRILAGVFLGYLLYWTNNIWVPIFAHSLNNIIAIVEYKMGLFNPSDKNSVLINSDSGTYEFYTVITLAIAGLSLFLLCAKKIKFSDT